MVFLILLDRIKDDTVYNSIYMDLDKFWPNPKKRTLDRL